MAGATLVASTLLETRTYLQGLVETCLIPPPHEDALNVHVAQPRL